MDSNYENMNLFDFMRLVYRKLAAFCKWVFNLFLSIVHLCLRYWYVMLACVVLGFFGARVWLMPKFTRYKGFATVTFAPGMKRYVEEGLVSFLTQPFSVKEEEYGISGETQLAMRKFLVYSVIDAKCDGDADYIDRNWAVSPTDTANAILKDRVAFRIDLWGRSNFDCFEQALSKWFNTQEKFTTPDSLFKKELRERLDYLNHEIARSDSFLDYKYFSNVPQAQQINVYSSDVEESKTTVMNYDEMLELMDEKERIENILTLNPEVINFQTHFYFEAMTPKQKYIIGLCVGFALGLILSLMIKYWSNVKKFILTK